MRDLRTVIDEILSLPGTEPARKGLESLKTSAMYSAPELMPGRWNEAASILSRTLPNHEQAKAVFRGDV